MLTDRTNALADGLLRAYLGWAVRRHFHSIRVGGHAGFRSFLSDTGEDTPLIFYGNHCSWWDGFFAYFLGRGHGLNMRVMMEERNLRRYPFFRYTGAFSIDLDNERSRAQSLLHAVRFLKDSRQGRRVLLIYPHGRLVSNLEPWPPFKPGLEALLRLCPNAQAVPVAHEIVPGSYSRPDVFIEVGEPIPGRDRPSLQRLESALRHTRNTLVEKALQAPAAEMFFIRQPTEGLLQWMKCQKTRAPWILPEKPSASSAAVTWAKQ